MKEFTETIRMVEKELGLFLERNNDKVATYISNRERMLLIESVKLVFTQYENNGHNTAMTERDFLVLLQAMLTNSITRLVSVFDDILEDNDFIINLYQRINNPETYIRRNYPHYMPIDNVYCEVRGNVDIKYLDYIDDSNGLIILRDEYNTNNSYEKRVYQKKSIKFQQTIEAPKFNRFAYVIYANCRYKIYNA